MKPVIITVKENSKDGKILLTKEELSEIIEKAYNEGVSDGAGSNVPIVYPQYPYNPVIYGTGTPWWYNPYVTITCEG